MADSYYSHQLPSSGQQADPVQRQTAFMLLEALRRELPGWQTVNRWNQSEHFTQIVYIAIRAIMDMISGSNVQAMRRKKPHRHRSTFYGPGGFIKAMPGDHHAQAEEYTPFDDLDHPLAHMAQRPNPVESITDVLTRLVLQNRLTGVGPLWCVPNSAGKPVELYTLETALMYPLWQQTRQYPFGAWQVQPYYAMGQYTMLPGAWGAGGAILPGEEVHRFLDPHPIIRWDGYSPLTAGQVGLDVLEAIDDSRWAAFDHGMQLDAILIAPGLDPDQGNKYLSQMQNRHSGTRNARRMGIISPPAGMDKFDIKPFGANNKEMDYNSSWEQAVSFVLALFGVPKGVVCLDAGGSYAKLYADLRQFHHRQSAFVHRMAEFLTHALAWPWSRFPGEYRFQIDLPKLDDPDLKEKKLNRQLSNDLITVNEARAADDMKPFKDGDVLPKIYIELQKKKYLPEEPPPAAAGQPAPAAAEQPAEDPLAALLAGADAGGAEGGKPIPGNAPTSKGVPVPENPLGKGSLPPQMAKAIAGEGEHRREGEVWESAKVPGHTLTLKNGHVQLASAAETPSAKPKAKAQLPKWAVQADLVPVLESLTHATGKTRAFIGNALEMAGLVDVDADGKVLGWAKNPFAEQDPDEVKRHLAQGLTIAYRDAAKVGEPAESLAVVGGMLEQLGAEKIGDDGAEVAFDGALHNGPAGAFSGHAMTVTRPGWAMPQGNGSSRVLLKAETAPLGTKSMSAYAAGRGGVLVPPSCPKKKRKRKKPIAFVNRILKSLDSGDDGLARLPANESPKRSKRQRENAEQVSQLLEVVKGLANRPEAEPAAAPVVNLIVDGGMPAVATAPTITLPPPARVTKRARKDKKTGDWTITEEPGD